MLAGDERSIGGLVANTEDGRLGHSVVVTTPNELDGVANGRVGSERHVTKDTLSRGDPNSVSCAGTRASLRARGGGGHRDRRGSAERGNAF